ncbi:MAG TPA: alpha/beta hydrolase [Steroidobacteraceae bacterium]|nr:alpha/beta hydrolase [Steroidobacteraceae bacterium]
MSIIDQIDPELRAAFLALPAGLVESPEAALKVREFPTEGLHLKSRPLGGIHRDVMVPGPSNAPDVKVRIYQPNDNPLPQLPALIWLHGGGYYMGDLDMEDGWLILLARAVNCIVVSVDYRLAPEHPFPAAIEDSHAALVWTHEHAKELGIDPQRIAIGGESGGGGLAAGLGIYARDKAEVPVAFQLLLAPMIDDRGVTHANKRITDQRLYNQAFGNQLWKFYLGASYGSDTVSPYAAAARATNLKGVAPAYIGIAELDLFVDECLDYARKLLEGGVRTELNVYPGAFHGFDRFAPEARVSKKFFADSYAALIKALHG